MGIPVFWKCPYVQIAVLSVDDYVEIHKDEGQSIGSL